MIIESWEFNPKTWTTKFTIGRIPDNLSYLEINPELKKLYRIKDHLEKGKEATGKPSSVKVLSKDCDNNWLIYVSYKEVEKTIMTKRTLWIFYEPAKQGRQEELFGKPETRVNKLKKKHLK